jgi:signal transduction histidine kinase
MLVIIFLEMFMAMTAVLGCMLVASQYLVNKRTQDIYVFLILVAAAFGDIGLLFSQIAFNLQQPFAYVGFKLLLYCIVLISILIWFHVANIYDFRSRIITMLVLACSAASFYYFCQSKVDLIFQEGVIVPVGDVVNFVFGFSLLALVVTFGSLISVTGLKRLEKNAALRYRMSRMAGFLFLIFFACFSSFVITRVIYFYVIMWFFSFLALLSLFLFAMLHEESPYIKYPINFFRTRILFKLIITLIVMIIISLEGMSFISINISKKALSESVIESYERVAEDTIKLMGTSRISGASEQNTLSAIARILESTKIGGRGAVFLVSPEKNIYINRENRWISLGSSQSFAKSQMLSGKVSGGEFDIFGEKVIAVYIPIKKLGWGIIVGQPINYAYARVKQMESTFIIFVFSWIILTIFIGVLLARNIEDPIKELKKGLLKISEGDLTYKINIGKIDELGELADNFNRMTEQLKESQESLIRSERLASLGYMAAGMAHEIKNALVPLKALTEMLSISGKDQVFIAKFNELVPKEIERINTLSTDLLHYSRPAEPVFEYLDLNDAIQETDKFLEVQAKKKNIAIKLKLSDISQVKADKGKIIEVLTNLILNAIEAMSGGEIVVSSYDKEDKVMIEISDNGPGIPEENINRVFVPFFTTRKEGTGMGLAITQRIIADHQGTIDLKSTLGVGTTFLLSFPQKS